MKSIQTFLLKGKESMIGLYKEYSDYNASIKNPITET